MRPPSSCSKPRTGSAARCAATTFGGRMVDMGPDGFLGRRHRGGRARPRGRARRPARADRRARRVGLRPGQAARPARGPGARHPDPLLADGAHGILGPRGQLGLAPRRPPAAARRARAARRPLHRPARHAQARAAGDRRAGRSPHRRHPRRARSTTCRRPPCSRHCSPRPDAGAASCARCGPRCPRPTPTARRSSGPSTAAWARWSPRWPTRCAARGVDIRLEEGATRLERRGDRWTVSTGAGCARGRRGGAGRARPRRGARSSVPTTTRRPPCSRPSTTPR